MAKTTAAGDDLHLPPEIRREILIRLPVKSILRFRSVRKSWYSLVSCPNFISDHSNLNKNPNIRVLLHTSSLGDGWLCRACSFSSRDKSFMDSRAHDEIPESFLDGYTSIVGSCNGLICLVKSGSSGRHGDVLSDFLIWNPTTRKIVQLPSRTYHGYPFYFGFGFDSKTRDYKLLSTFAKDGSPNKVFQILDLKKGVWRDISPYYDNELWYTVGRSQDCYLDGAVYWSGPEMLLSFNLSDECFREISLPDYIYHGVGGFVTVKSATFGGLVYVIVFRERHEDDARKLKSFAVWTTESWTKVYYIDLLPYGEGLPSIGPNPNQFLLWEDGQVLMVHERPNYEKRSSFSVLMSKMFKHDLVLYKTGWHSKCMLSFTERIRSVCLYEESLALM